MLELAGPLFAAFLYSLSTLFTRRALQGGMPVSAQLAAQNYFSVGIVGVTAYVASGGVLVENWSWPLVGACFFLAGQLLVVLALRVGDSSIQTPIMGLKVLFVSAVVAVGFGETVSLETWVAAALAAGAVFLIGYRPERKGSYQSAPVLAAVGATMVFAGSDSILAEVSGELGRASFLASLLLVLAVLTLPILALALRDTAAAAMRPPAAAPGPLRRGVPRPGAGRGMQRLQPGAVRDLVIGSTFMALQFGLFASVLMVYSHAPSANVLFNTRGLWSVVFLWVLNRAGHGHHMEHASGGLIARRFVGAALLVAAVAFAV
jgi:drug/metabolite transporter (DMT)-like permease